MKKPALYSDRFTIAVDGIVRVGFLEAEGNVGSVEHTAVILTRDGAATLAVELLKAINPRPLNFTKDDPNGS